MFRATILSIFGALDCAMLLVVWSTWKVAVRYQTIDRQPIRCNIPQAALHSLMLLMMGKIVARKMSS
jgi:hypothetical protein